MSDGREAKEGERPPSPKPQVAVPTTATEEQKRKKMTENAEKLCREVDSVAQSNLQEAIDRLLALEKKGRMAGFSEPTSMVAVKILKLCRAANNFKLVNEYLMLLSKRSGQLKQVISKTVEEGTSYIDGLNRADQIELIETLRAITEGKLFVEVERARLTKRLADIYESDGNLHKASKTLQEVQVETVGGMAMHERIQLLLEQIRLCLAEGDYVRTQIISNKVQQKHLQKEEHKDLRIRFYEQQIELHKYKRDPVALWKDFESIYRTPDIGDSNPELCNNSLRSMIIFLALSPWSNEVSDMMNRLKSEKRLEQFPLFKQLLTNFTTPEIFAWPLNKDLADVIRSHPIVAPDAERSTGAVHTSAKAERVVGDMLDVGVSCGNWWDDLKKRVIQHNFMVLGKYYTRVRFPRLCTLLSLTEKDAEAFLSEMVTEKFMYAKYDRPAGVVSFAKPKAAPDVLEDWASDLSQLLGLVEKVSHVIDKERQVHSLRK